MNKQIAYEIDCECESPRVRRHTEESGPFGRHNNIQATREYDLMECLGCGKFEPVRAASYICTVNASPHYDSDCAPVSSEELWRKGNVYYILSKTVHEAGAHIHGRDTISSRDADAIIESSCSKDCRDCGRSLEGRRDYQVPYLCHVCAGIRLEA